MKTIDWNALPAGLATVIAILAFITAVFWVIFPVIVWAKLSQILHELKRLRASAEEIELNTRSSGSAPTAPSAVQYRVPGVND